MEINFLQTSLSDLNKEKTLRFDVKFHDVFTKVVETKKVRPFLDFFKPAEKKCAKYDLDKIKYVEIGSVTTESEVNPFDLSNKEVDLTEKERLIKKIENGDIFKPEKGGILITSVRPNLKKFIPITDSEQDLYFTKAFIYLQPKQDLIDSRLLKYLLRTVLFKRLVGLCREGKGYPTLKEDDIDFFFIDNELIKKIEQNRENLLRKIDKNERAISRIKPKIESLQDIIDDVFEKFGYSTKPRLKRDEEYILRNRFSSLSKTNWLSTRTYLCRFIEDELPLFLKENLRGQYIPFSRYVKKIKSGEYIPKKYYSLEETNFVYLRVNNISSNELNLEEPIYLTDPIGEKYRNIAINENDLILTRSGTVGKSIIFTKQLDDERIYIPSHHLAVIQFNNLEDALFLKYYIQSSFGSDFFWAFSTGKSQKEITNWSIRKLPIPNIDNRTREKIVSEIHQQEEKNNQYKEQIKKLREEIDNLIYQRLR